jgi:FkbM family methyltransferase
MAVRFLKGLFKQALARCGFYLGRYPEAYSLSAHLLQLFQRLRINCVLDVGAHHGVYGQLLRNLGYRGRIVSFESIPENFALLERQRAGDRQWHTHRWALGNQPGTAEITVRRGTDFTSFRAPNQYGQEQFGSSLEAERVEVVEVKRLDSVLEECLAGIEQPRVFLKIDTQGFDREVLEGAGQQLGLITALQTELSVKPLYEGMSTSLLDMIAFLQEHGFELTGLFPVTWDATDQLRVIEFDCVMCRPPQPGPARLA